jgi:hypothetical protein
MEILFKTKMEELPKNCVECSCQWCRLPCKNNTYDLVVKKKYTTQRHEECPLRVGKDT